jgi:hypothetical protein
MSTRLLTDPVFGGLCLPTHRASIDALNVCCEYCLSLEGSMGKTSESPGKGRDAWGGEHRLFRVEELMWQPWRGGHSRHRRGACMEGGALAFKCVSMHRACRLWVVDCMHIANSVQSIDSVASSCRSIESDRGRSLTSAARLSHCLSDIGGCMRGGLTPCTAEKLGGD